MRGIVGVALVDQAEYQLGGAVLDLNADPTRPTGVRVEVDVGEGFVDPGQHPGRLGLAEPGMESPLFREGTQAVEAGWGELDFEHGFGGRGSRVHAI